MSEPPFSPGDRARFTQGLFDGYEVVITSVDVQARTVQVTMMVFDHPVELSFSFEQAVMLISTRLAQTTD